ncbi:MAG TPA: carboxypeptidase regulatory-like domain-containing protein [Bryobacteraceae bacterium]
MARIRLATAVVGLLLGLGGACPAGFAFGQGLNYGTFAGAVKDPSGADVPDTTVRLIRSDTNTTRETTTDSNGTYKLLNVAPGTYRLEFEHTGFKKEVRTDIPISAGESLRVDANLTLGTLSDAVQVSTKVAEVDTATANVGSTVFGSQVRELALNTRSFTQLMTLQPGVASSQAQQPGFGSNTSVPFSFNGAQQSSNNWLVDGGRNIDTYNGNNITMINLDAIAEVRIERNAYLSEYGRNAGAQVNVITKSGGDAFHGSLFEFFRNNVLNARNFFAAGIPENRYNNFGGTVGGPIKKDKLFFFLSNEYRRIIQSAGTRTTIVPTAAQLAGNFAGGRTIVDPLTGKPFPNNQIPTGRLDPNALLFLKTFYVPPTPGFQQGSLNYTNSAPDTTNYRSGLGRVDYTVSPTLSMFARYNIDSVRLYSPFGLFSTNPMPTSDASEQGWIADTGNFSATWTPRPNLVNEFTTSFFHLSIGIAMLPSDARAVAPDLNIPRVFNTQTDSSAFIPSISLGQGYASIAIGYPQNISGYTIEVFDNLSYIVGKHTFKFGGYVSRENKTQDNSNPNNNGSFTFNGSITGDSLADMLLGSAYQYTENSAHLLGSLRYSNVAGFAQDQWQATPRLSLTYGVRYEFFQPEADSAGTISYFDPTRFVASQAAQVMANGQIVSGTQNFGNGIVVAGKNSPYGYQLTNSERLKFSPRVGFAYSLTKDNLTVLRGGYGEFFDRWPQYASQARNNYPFNQSVSIFNTSFSNPAQGSLRIFPIGLSNFNSPWDIPVLQKYSLGIQRQLPAGLVLDASYVGSQGSHLILTEDTNQPIASATVASGAVSPNAVRPYPGFAAINSYTTSGTSNYNSLQVSVVKRLSRSFSVEGAYTFSKMIDDVTTPANSHAPLSVERGIDSFDRTHVLTLSYVWQIPFAHSLTGFGQKVLDGWQISGITSAESGNPLTPVLSVDRAGTGDGSQRPNVIGPVAMPETLLSWFNPLAFSLPALGTFGNAGRSLVWGPGFFNTDLSVSKRAVIRENIALQFRAEFFNVFNHTQFAGIGTTFGAGTFGQVTSARDPRITQFGLRLTF